MKKIFVMMFALTLGMGAANAQEVTNAETVETTEQATKVSLCKEIYPDAERDGDFYHGLCLNVFFMVRTATRRLFCHVSINRNVKTKIFSYGHFYFIG